MQNSPTLIPHHPVVQTAREEQLYWSVFGVLRGNTLHGIQDNHFKI